MSGGETFIPKIPSVRITDLAKAMAPNLKTKIIGIRPGEKIHELMCPNEMSDQTIEFKDHYVIFPSPKNFDKKTNFFINKLKEKGKKVSENFEYDSKSNKKFLSINEIKNLNKNFFFR